MIMFRSPLRSLGLLLLLILVSGCGGQLSGSNPKPTPASFPAPPTLPTRPAAAAPTAEPTATPVFADDPPPVPTAEPTPTAEPVERPASLRLPSAYVSAVSARLYATPGSGNLASLPAGARLGLLGRSGDGRWLQVQYQPDPNAPAGVGWVQAAVVTTFTDLDALAVGDGPSTNSGQTAAAGEPLAAAPAPGEVADVLGRASVNADRLNLRAGPGVNQRVIGSMARSEQVGLLGRTSDRVWVQVETGGGERGWAAGRYLQAATNIAELPITAEALTGIPAPSPAGGKIVFQTGNGGEIYLINANGSGLRRLTSGFDPAFSPDGSQVAFTRWDDPRGLWLIDVNGGNERLLIGAERARSPAWTPDGSAIVFERSSGTVACYDTPFGCLSEGQLNDILGGNECIDTPFGRFCRSDFPLRSQALGGLVRYDLNDGSLRDLPAAVSARAPFSDPTGDSVIYLDDKGLARTRAIGNDAPQRVVELPGLLGPAVVSPDGQFIFGIRRSGDHWDIWRWNGDGSGERALTAPPAIRSAPINAVAPTLSPDGRTILFLSDRRGRWELWQMNADSGNQRPFAAAALQNISIQYEYANERVADWGR